MKGKIFKRVTALLSTAAMLLTYADFSAIDFSVHAENGDEPILTDFDVNGNGEIDAGEENWGYKLDSADDLYWFADMVNNENATYGNANAFLAEDITVNENLLTELITVDEDGTATVKNEENKPTAWTPIGTYTNEYVNSPYSGIFDGAGYTISGLYFNESDADYVGLFGYVGTGGKIQDVTIADSYFCGSGRVGGICGRNYDSTIENAAVADSYMYGNSVGGVCGYNTGTITNCYNTGDVTGSNDVGGVCGFSYDCTIENCYNTGDVSGSDNVGGVCGENHQVSISNCYNTGNVSGSDNVGGVCGDNSLEGTITNCYYLDTVAENGIGRGIPGSAEAKSAELFASGEVCWLLNDGQSDNPVFYQNIGKDISPVLDSTHHAVKHSETSYYNEHSYENGICTVCDGYEPAELVDDTEDIDGDDDTTDKVYEISNAGQLYWFADKVDNDNDNFGEANAVLTKNITVNSGVLDEDGELNSDTSNLIEWTPIVFYSGTFDGNNKTISGLYFNKSDATYVGLFGLNYGTIENVNVTDSYFYGSKYVGGVCGYNKGTIENCSNAGSVNGKYYVGGVCGDNLGTITNCYNTGDVTATGEYDYVGGVCGENFDTITNCYNTGDVSGNSKVGGVCGYNPGSISNCYNTGDVSGNLKVGGVCGYNEGTITNCYYLDTTAETGIGSNESTGSAETTAKSETEFANGEVCWLLNGGKTQAETPVFYQNIGTDAFPVLDSTHNTVYRTSPCVSYSNTTENKEHSLDSFTKVEATCTTNGHEAYWYCKDCGKYFSDEACTDTDVIADIDAWKTGDGKIAATGHTITPTEEKKATCTEDGCKAYWYCSVCKKYFSDEACADADVIADIDAWKSDPANGRLWMLMHQKDYYPETKATCTTNGHKAYYHCSLCDQYFSNSALTEVIEDIDEWLNDENGGKIPATGHNLTKSNEIKADCTNDGYKAYWFCSNSMKFFSDEACTKEIDDINEWLNDVNGGKIPAGHKIKKEDKLDATCTTDGHKAYWYCQECGDYFSDEACENRIYSIDEWLNDVNGGKIPGGHNVIKEEKHNATCTTDGCEAYWYCSVCKKYFSDEECKNEIANIDTWKLNDGKIPGGHNGIKQEKYNATCTTDGYSEYWYCKDCGKYFSNEGCADTDVIADIDAWKTGGGRIPAGHNYGDDGVCTVCHKDRYEKGECGENASYKLDTETGILTISGTGAIWGSAFYGNAKIKEVVIGDGITEIGYFAFEECESLEIVEIPASVTSIGQGVFDGTKWINTAAEENNGLVIVNGILIDGKSCSGEVVIPDEVTSIVGSAFYECTSITSVTFGENSKLESIGSCAFNSCEALESIEIPASVTSIGSDAFRNTKWIKSVAEENNGLVIVNGILIDGKSCSGEVVIPDEVTSIVGSAFYDCTSITSITFGENSKLESIDKYAFQWCKSLKSITIPDSVTSIGDYAFNYCGALESVTFGKNSNLEIIGDSAFYFCEALESVTFGENSNLEIIGDSAFYLCKALTSITIPASVTSIGNSAFYSCYALESVTFGENSNLEIIGNYAFEWCKSLKSITIPDSVTSIGNSAFECCYALENISIPASVTSIGNSAFNFCTSLTSITAPCTLKNNEIIADAVSEYGTVVTWNHDFESGICENCGAFEDGIGARLAGHTLTLDGSIGVNFYMELDKSVAEDENAYMHFTLPNGKTEDVNVSQAEKKNVNGMECYVFKCNVAATEMTDTIKAQIKTSSGNGTEYSYTVKEYADYLFAHTADNKAYEDAEELVRAMLNYGAYAQKFKEYNTDSLPCVPSDVSEYVINEHGYTAYAGAKVEFAGANLSMLSNITLRLFFKADDITDVKFMNGAKELEIGKNNELYFVEIANITPDELSNDFTVSISDGGLVTYSPMTYCYQVSQTSNDAALVNLVKAIAQYNDAAKAYFKEAKE